MSKAIIFCIAYILIAISQGVVALLKKKKGEHYMTDVILSGAWLTISILWLLKTFVI